VTKINFIVATITKKKKIENLIVVKMIKKIQGKLNVARIIIIIHE
jgi:hypothetical protein